MQRYISHFFQYLLLGILTDRCCNHRRHPYGHGLSILQWVMLIVADFSIIRQPRIQGLKIWCSIISFCLGQACVISVGRVSSNHRPQIGRRQSACDLFRAVVLESCYGASFRLQPGWYLTYRMQINLILVPRNISIFLTKTAQSRRLSFELFKCKQSLQMGE